MVGSYSKIFTPPSSSLPYAPRPADLVKGWSLFSPGTRKRTSTPRFAALTNSSTWLGVGVQYALVIQIRLVAAANATAWTNGTGAMENECELTICAFIFPDRKSVV